MNHQEAHEGHERFGWVTAFDKKYSEPSALSGSVVKP
jgi:hypothetical protein